jgi:hypothetical protein
VWATEVSRTAVMPSTAERLCGTLIQGVECVLFQPQPSDAGGGSLLLLDWYGNFHVGDPVCVTGVRHVCATICQQETTCFAVSTIEAQQCTAAPCGGTCFVGPPQCAPRVPCPLFPTSEGACQVVSGKCACVTGVVPSPTVTPTPVGTPVPVRCFGDCNVDGRVTVDELLTGTMIALGNLPVSACPAFDCTSDCGPGPARNTPLAGRVTIRCLLRAVHHALNGCPPDSCRSDQDCDDGNPCSFDRCTATGCTHDCLCV